MRLARRFSVIVSEGRIAAQMTQEELAAALDVTQSTIHNWERKKAPQLMSPARIRELARLIKADPAEIAESLGYPVHAVNVDAAAGGASHLPPEVQEFQAIGEAFDDLRERFAALERRYGPQDKRERESNLGGGPV